MLFEITRNGEKGDQNTSYEIFPITDTEFYDICTYNEDDLPEPFDPIGKMVMKKILMKWITTLKRVNFLKQNLVKK